MIELRCGAKLHGEIHEEWIEVKCRSRWCGAINGVVVIHRFDRQSGKLLNTLRFKDPGKKNFPREGD